MRLEVGEHCGDVRGAREPTGKDFARDLLERELVSLTIQRGEDFVETQKIADQRQVFPVARELRLRERTGYDTAEFRDVAHVDDAPLGIEWQRPTQRTIRLFLRSHGALQVLIIERRDHKGVARESRLTHDAINLCFVREMRDINRATTDRLHIRQR